MLENGDTNSLEIPRMARIDVWGNLVMQWRTEMFRRSKKNCNILGYSLYYNARIVILGQKVQSYITVPKSRLLHLPFFAYLAYYDEGVRSKAQQAVHANLYRVYTVGNHRLSWPWVTTRTSPLSIALFHEPALQEGNVTSLLNLLFWNCVLDIIVL